MAFGSPAGPPATSKQVQYLLDLIVKAGYEGFRDARRPLGLTQRQAGGKFTRAEASALIERLLAADDDAPVDDAAAGDAAAGDADDDTRSGPHDEPATGTDRSAKPDPYGQLARTLPTDVLAGELRRRGWRVDPPR